MRNENLLNVLCVIMRLDHITVLVATLGLEGNNTSHRILTKTIRSVKIKEDGENRSPFS